MVIDTQIVHCIALHRIDEYIFLDKGCDRSRRSMSILYKTQYVIEYHLQVFYSSSCGYTCYHPVTRPIQ
jgi:hypothetical protein